MTLSAPTVLADDSSTTDLNSYATASVATTAGSRIVILAVSGRSGNSAEAVWQVQHPSITDFSEVLHVATPNNNAQISVWTCTGNGFSGSFSITHALQHENCAWHVVEFTSDNGTPTIRQSAELSTAAQNNQGATLASAALSSSCVIGALAINAGSSITPTNGSGFTTLGTRRTMTSPVNQIMSEYDNTSPPSQALFGFGSSSHGKALAAVEVADAVVTGPTVKLWNGSSEVSATVTLWNGTSEVSLTPHLA